MRFSLNGLVSSRSICPNNYLKLFFFSNFNGASSSLYRRISPIGSPNVSIVPVLDQWVQEGRPTSREDLQNLIREFRIYKRFKHALEVSQWMTDNRYIPLTNGDVAVRMNLICRVHGIEQVENYFDNLPQKFKGYEVYTALLNCYAHDKAVEKAEAVMQKLKDMEWARTALSYNIMMNLYYRTGNWEKLDSQMREMEERDIKYDMYTFSIRLSAYAAASDSEGVDKIVARMESDPGFVLDWKTCSIVAKVYLKVGSVDKALVMLNKFEQVMETAAKWNFGLDALLKLYAESGKKDELYRIWNKYKKKRKIYNKGYISMMSSLLMFNDIEGAEKIFKIWESSGLSYDFRIPDLMIEGYCKNSLLLGKAEEVLNKGIAKGGNPTSKTWCYLAGAYIEQNQVSKAVETLKKAVLMCSPDCKPNKDILVTGLNFLESGGEVEEAEEFIRILKKEDIFSAAVHDKLLDLVKEGKSQSRAHSQLMQVFSLPSHGTNYSLMKFS